MASSIVVAGLATLAALAQPPAAPPPPADEPDSTAMALTVVDNRMTVAVTIDGAGPFRFLVDSGATRTVISDRVAAMLRLKGDAPVILHSVGGEGVVQTVRIAALGVGALRARPIVAPVLAEADIGAAGIVGLDALARGRMVLDIARNRMTIERAETRPAPLEASEIVVTARRRYGQLVLADADAAGQRIWAVVDTGSMATIGNGVLRDRLTARRRAEARAVTITDVTGRSIAAAYAPLADVRLSAWHLKNVVVAFCDAHAFDRFGLSEKPSMLLGMDVMRAFSRVSIDFRDRTVRLLKRDEA
ncbi:retropepsin-like aspartic protease [Sphingomonas sp.]|uniref:retropepsin-like aspartic protease n=1 Tax=Sphingomonas sp. TaxID=28214 RepID=UPI003B007CC3